MSAPKLAVTMGDPAGIGPELCLRLFSAAAPTRDLDLTIFGSAQVLENVAAATGLAPTSRLRDFGPLPKFDPGTISAGCGQAAYDYLAAAIEACLAGEFDGLVTCPLHKKALHAAGLRYAGHTEILVARTAARSHAMMLTAPGITCSLVTTHLPLREVTAHLSTERIVEVAVLTAATMDVLLGRPPRLAILGLNPHAGEHGLFGSEEEEIILPAISAARRRGLDVVGPLPPDTAFIAPWRARIDAYICMYHDQGLIPLKTLAFDQGVNVTLGLPVVRTSVDHGTAYDIAWKGMANPASLYTAVELAGRLTPSRHPS